MLPIFVIFIFIFVKIFALLVLVQKVEIASFYAARRWQLESHRNQNYNDQDETLKLTIKTAVQDYLGYKETKLKTFFDLTSVDLKIERTQVWQVLTLTVKTKPFNVLWTDTPVGGFEFNTVKYVPNRDRPIAFELPGLK